MSDARMDDKDAPDEDAPSSVETVEVEIEILGKSRVFTCRAGEEERLRAHAGELERRLAALGGARETRDESRLLIAAALQLADELYETHMAAEAHATAHRDDLARRTSDHAEILRRTHQRVARATKRLAQG